MASGAAAARDLRYGRRGGGWAEGSPVDVALEELRQLRRQGLKAGTWPDHARDAWLARAAAAAERSPEYRTLGDLHALELEPLLEEAGRG